MQKECGTPTVCCEEFKTDFGNVFYESFKITFYCR